MTFELTPDKIILNAWVLAGAASLSIALCLFVLAASVWIWWKPSARHHLDRISFRLVLWTMVFQLAYDGSCLFATVYTAAQTETEPVCIAGVYVTIATMNVVNYLYTCIAINLMLIICFRVNPARLRLERWYIIGSILLGMGIPAIPATIGHFGIDPVIQVCWIIAREDAPLLNLVIDLYLWQLLSAVIAAVAIVITIGYIVRQHRHASRAMYSSNTLNQQPSALSPRSEGPVPRMLDDYTLRTAYKISLYPMMLIVITGVISGADLYIASAGGVFSEAVYALYCVYYFLYGGRGIFFALLGIFVDPCLRNGMREAWRSPTKPTLPPFMTSSGLNDSDYKGGVTEKTSDKQTEAVSMLPTLGYTAHGHGSSSGPSESNSNSNGDEQPGLDPNRRGSGNTDLEIEDALSALPNPDSEEQQRQQQQRDEQRRVGTGSTRPALEQSRSFRGVASDSLPDGLTDDVDADLTLEVAPWRRPSEGEMRVARGGEVNGYDDLDGLVRQL